MRVTIHYVGILLVFAEITHRFQTAREDVRALLIQCLLPWLHNMELVATSVPPATPLSYIMVSAVTPTQAYICTLLYKCQDHDSAECLMFLPKSH